MRSYAIAAAASVLLASVLGLVAPPVGAITYGSPDGNLHPNVGALVGAFPEGTFPYCSGTLIAPNVYLTAAHCDISAETGTAEVFVTFDPVFTPSSELHRGMFIPHARFSKRQNDPHDIAVVIFDLAVPDLDPARLPSRGQLDSLPKKQKFTSVGYGGQERVHEGPGAPVIGFLDIREFSVGTLNAINPSWLRISQNPAKGDGGTCFGDSGGPNFLGAGAEETDIIAAITITGDSVCRATNVDYRLDTDAAREFLATFVPLPD